MRLLWASKMQAWSRDGPVCQTRVIEVSALSPRTNLFGPASIGFLGLEHRSAIVQRESQRESQVIRLTVISRLMNTEIISRLWRQEDG